MLPWPCYQMPRRFPEMVTLKVVLAIAVVSLALGFCVGYVCRVFKLDALDAWDEGEV